MPHDCTTTTNDYTLLWKSLQCSSIQVAMKLNKPSTIYYKMDTD